MSRLRIVQISDSHFGTVLPGVTDGLLATIRNLQPDLVVLSGDITQRARPSQFREAYNFSEQLRPIPFIAVPGNHDIPLFNVFGRLFDPYKGFQTNFKNQLEKDFDHGDVVIVGLNSTSRWRHVQGAFDLERLKRRLDRIEPRHKVRIAVFHHPLDCRQEEDLKNLIKCRDQVMQILSERGIDLVVGGHIHDPHVSLSRARYPEIQRALVLGVAGTCTSWRTRGDVPNSFNLIDVHTESEGDARLTIARFDMRENLRFTLENKRSFIRSNSQGWQDLAT